MIYLIYITMLHLKVAYTFTYIFLFHLFSVYNDAHVSGQLSDKMEMKSNVKTLFKNMYDFI